MNAQLEFQGTTWTSYEIATLHQLLDKGILSEERAKEAASINSRHKTPLRDILAALDAVSLKDYASNLAEISTNIYVSNIIESEHFVYNIDFIRQFDPALMARFLFIPLYNSNGIVTVLTADPDEPRLSEWVQAVVPGADVIQFVGTERDIKRMLRLAFHERFTYKAVEELRERNPVQSASQVFTSWQIGAALLLLALTVIGLMADVWTTLSILVVLASCFYVVGISFRLLISLAGAPRGTGVRRDASKALKDNELPVYSILVPVYKEPQVVPSLLRALANIDYPHEKLDVLLLLEEDDLETIAQAKAAAPPAYFRFIIVPKSHPRTKPKACNYGLNFCRGEYVTIYDAEDIPEPDQLRKAVAAFQKGDDKLICVQAALNYYNADENYLTRMFTLEYTYWFDYILVGLDRLKLPIPLGGTSNHFHTEKLRKLMAWDPFNVTEDADLGIRAAANGYTVGVIHSTTYEEANKEVGNWIRQRSRWIKGYMQTGLVHNRNPLRLFAAIGPKNWVSYQLLIGGTVIVFLLNPVMWLMFGLWVLFQPAWMSQLFQGWVWDLAFFSLLFGNGIAILLNAIAALSRKQYRFFFFALTNPLYWCLHSIAAYKALWQLLSKPFYWEKTTHGLTTVQADHLFKPQATGS